MALMDFDYSNGSVFVQDGTIFYSPNSSRPVVIPSRPDHNPFYQGRFDASTLKQPVWWSQSWAWLSFVPLAPSFVSAPFEPLCAMPRIENVTFSFVAQSGERQTESRFRMSEVSIERWFAEEKHLVDAAYIIMLRYGINANAPPKPSSFGFDRTHKSHRVAKRMICFSREWFAIWMGYLSYLIAKTSTLVPSGVPDQSSPLPDWYNHLRNEHGFSLAWLDGLLTSTVCTFDRATPRTGIVFQWSEENRLRESIEWYFNHHIPLFFVWSSKEEQIILYDRSLAHLQPPDNLVKEALIQLFSNSNLPLPSLIIQKYFRLGDNPITNKMVQLLRLQYAPSLIFELTTNKFLAQESPIEAGADASLQTLAVEWENKRQAAAQAASSFPYHGLQTTFQDPWKQFAASSSTANDWAASSSNWGATSSMSNDWAAASSVSNDWPTTAPEPASSMPTTVQKQKKPFNHYNDFFAARKKRQEELMKLESPRDRQRRESREKQPAVKSATVFVWEKSHSSGGCEVYQRVKANKKENEDIYCHYKRYQRIYNAFANEWDFCTDFRFGVDDEHVVSDDSDDDYEDPRYPADFVSQPTHSAPLTAPMDVETDQDSFLPKYSRDPFETMSLVYGYVPHSGNNSRSEHNWDGILRFLGFVKNLTELDVPQPEKNEIINFFTSVVNGSDDLTDQGFQNLTSLFDFNLIQRPSNDLFVFSSLQSSACQWVLGVHSPAAALYVCRYIIGNPHAHTILTVAQRLLDRGIPFRTLMPLSCNPRQVTVSMPYMPRTYRLDTHNFTKDDFDAAMLTCQSVLKSPQGRAALLRGGIIGRIAKEYLSKDGVLDGPSIEVTVHRVGYIGPSATSHNRFCDDELTDNEIAIICGTYSFYTGKFSILHNIYILTHFPQPLKVKLLYGHGFLLQQLGRLIVLVAIGWIGQSGVKRFS